MREDPHQIRRLVIELRLPDAEVAAEAQARFSRLCRDRILSMLDRCCSSHCGPDQTLRIDSIEIDLGRISPDWRDEDVLTRIGDELGRRLGELQVPSTPGPGHTRDGQWVGAGLDQRGGDGLEPWGGSDLELFEHFVRNGHLPWWANADRPRLIHKTLVRLIEDAPEALTSTLLGLLREDRPLKRLVRHLDEGMRSTLLGLMAGTSADAPAALPRALLGALSEAAGDSSPAPGRDLSAEFWETALATAARGRSVEGLPSTFWVEVLHEFAARRQIDLMKLVRALRMSASTAGADARFRGTLLTVVEALEARIPAAGSEDGIPSRLRMDSEVVIEKEAIGCHGLDSIRVPQAPAGPRVDDNPWHPERISRSGQPGDHPEIHHGPSSRAHRSRRDRAEAEEIEVANAGLVLLWPFLRLFFDRLDLLDADGFRDPAATHRAVGLLGYLAHAEPEPAEYRLPLAKVLCGMDLEEVLDFGPPVGEGEAEECSGLLAAVIEHASILGSMSIDGFRGSFLLRKGLLGTRDGAWLLRVEPMTFDVVLERFPWSWPWIRLPWMEAPLRVEWP